MKKSDKLPAFDKAADEVAGVWRRNGIKESSIYAYLLRVRQFEAYWACRETLVEVWLRHAYVAAYADDYYASRNLDRSNTFASMHSAVYAWSWGLASLGFSVPPWDEEPVIVSQAPAIVEEFIRYRLTHRGISESRPQRKRNTCCIFSHVQSLWA